MEAGVAGQDPTGERQQIALVPDALAPPPRHPRFPMVDGLRAVAVLTVVGAHAAVAGGAVGESFTGRLLSQLGIGVTIFFLISGFLLYRPFVAHRGGGPSPPRVSAYAKRRFLRIVPAYWLVVTVLVLAPGVTGAAEGEVLQQYALVQALPLSDGAGCTPISQEVCDLAHTWSLGVEVTFYAGLPFLVFIGQALTKKLELRGWVAAQLVGLALLAALSLALHFGRPLTLTRSWIGGSVLGFGLWFALGMALAVVSVAVQARGRRPSWLGIAARPAVAWTAAAGGYVALCLSLPPIVFLDKTYAFISHVGAAVVALLLMLPAIFEPAEGSRARRLFGSGPLAWLGLVSYGIFLWHVAFTTKLGVRGADFGFPAVLALTLVLSVAVAALSYYVVERPLLRFKNRPLRLAFGSLRLRKGRSTP